MEFCRDREEEERAIFSGKLNKLMLDRNIKQADIGRKLNIAPSTLSDWTAGVLPTSHYRRVELAKFFGYPTSDALFLNNGMFSSKEIDKLKDRIKKLEFENYMLERQMALPCMEDGR